MNKELKKEPIDHIYLYKIINKPVALKLCNLIDCISDKLTQRELRELRTSLTDLADYVLLKELYS